MESTVHYFRSNALFLVVLIASLTGHVSLKWLRLAAALEPQMAQLESGRNSVSVQLIAEAAAEVQPPEPLPVERFVPEPTEVPHSEVSVVRSVPEEFLPTVQPSEHAEPLTDAIPPPQMQRREVAQPAQAEVHPPAPRIPRRSAASTVTLADAQVEVPETVISQQSSGSEVPPSFAARPLPPYPSNLLLRRIEGVVALRVTIDPQGRVKQAAIHSSSGYAEMDESALRTVGRWTFTPARRAGMPIEKTVIVPVRFKIRNAGS